MELKGYQKIKFKIGSWFGEEIRLPFHARWAKYKIIVHVTPNPTSNPYAFSYAYSEAQAKRDIKRIKKYFPGQTITIKKRKGKTFRPWI